MTEELLYSLWLQKVIGEGGDADGVLSIYGSPKSVYTQSESELRLSGALLPSQIKRFSSFKIEDAYNIIKRCDSLGQKVICYSDSDYPELLKQIKNPPLVLYVSGDISCLNDSLCISIVGSRAASDYSMRIATAISAQISRAGVTVVSGGALGIDYAAHKGALSVNGKTVAVLGCGINTDYLRANENLRRDISKTGALISEFSPNTPATARNFPIRNRIISGLSRGTLVIEAGDNSGSLITARLALEQNRDVFAVPGDITSADYTGVNKLIREGAKAVFSAKDVLSEYMWVYDLQEETISEKATEKMMDSVKSKENVKKEAFVTEKTEVGLKEKRELFDGVSENTKKVYDVFKEEPLYTDEIVALTKLEPNCVFTALTELEIYGFIKMIKGKRYITV